MEIKTNKTELKAVIATALEEYKSSINTQVDALQAEVKSLREQGMTEAEIESKTAKMQESINDAQTKFSETVMTEKALEMKEFEDAQTKAFDAMEQKIKMLEKFTATPADAVEGGLKTFAGTDEAKEFASFLQNPRMATKLLNTETEATGGALVPTPLANEIIKKISEISPMRAISRVIRLNSKTLKVPTRESLPVATWEAEGSAPASETQTVYGSKSVTAQKLTAFTRITREQVQDADFDMMNEIVTDMSESFAIAEGKAFLNGVGAGSNEPNGLLVDPSVATVETETSGTLTLKDVMLLAGELKTGYNPVYGIQRQILAKLRTETDANGQFLWKGDKTEIDGYRVVEMPDLDNTAVAGDVPVVFGDFARGYRIYDRKAMEMIVDPYTEATAGIIKVVFFKWMDSMVALPEAFVKLEVKA